MTRASRFLSLCAFAGLCVASTGHAATGHVAVISIDGLGASELNGRPSCIPPKGAIRALMRDGVHARGVASVLPAITYPAHATMVTGLNPDRHGVIDNGIGGQWFKQRTDIKADTLWDAVRKAGHSVAIVTWPSTYGAEVDHLIPEDLANASDPTNDIRAGSTPGLFDALIAGGERPGLLPFMQLEAGTPLDAMTARFAVEIVKRHKPRLLLAHFLDYDHRMHAGPFSPDACKALARLDAHVSEIREAYRAAGLLARTTFFVVSDHGFLEVKKVLNAYAMLKDARWDDIAPGEALEKSFSLKVAGGSIAFYPPAGSQGLDADRLRKLRANVEAKHGNAVSWMTPEKARSLGGFPGALFTLCARPGYSISPLSPTGPLLSDPVKYPGAHGYCPEERGMDAVFIASGHCVKKGNPLPRMSLADVAPTVARFLNAKLGRVQGRDRSAQFRAPSC
jgi:hypothetical protein